MTRTNCEENAVQSRPVPAPAQERWFECDGVRMRYLHCACSHQHARPPVLLIHGLLGYSFSWRFNLAAMAEEADVYAIDLPGVGFSARPPRMDRSARGIAQLMWRFLDEVGCDRVDVIGTSHGGAVATQVAAHIPDRVRKLVLVGAVNPWSEHSRWQARVLSTTVGVLLFRCVWPCLGVVNGKLLARMYGDPRRIAPGTVEGYALPLAIAGTLDHLTGIMRGWREDVRELKAALPKIANLPTLLLWGSRDHVVPLRSALKLQRQFAQAELVIMDGLGHLPYEEAPAEFNRVVNEFLSR